MHCLAGSLLCSDFSVLSLVFVNTKTKKVNDTVCWRAGHLQLCNGSCNLLKGMVRCSNGLDMGIQRCLFFISGVALLDVIKLSFTNMFSVHYFFQHTSLNQMTLLFRYFSCKLYPPKPPIQRYYTP